MLTLVQISPQCYYHACGRSEHGAGVCQLLRRLVPLQQHAVAGVGQGGRPGDGEARLRTRRARKGRLRPAG